MTHGRAGRVSIRVVRSARVLALVLVLAGLAATAAQAAVPAATTGAARNITQASARLLGTVDANQEPTNWYVEYGTTLSYGLRTPDQGPITGNNPQQVGADVSGLAPGTQYYYRLVAVNASGTASGRNRTFRTPAAVALTANRNPVDFGQSISFSGGLSGTGVGGVRVILEQNLYPFTGFAEVASGTTDVNGRFAFLHAPVAHAAYRVSTASGNPPARSASILALVRNKVTIRPSTSRPRRGRSVTFSGTVAPAQIGHIVYVQRLGRRGWRTVARGTLAATTSPLIASYSARLRRPVTGVYRAYIPMKLAHLAGTSSSRRVRVRG